MVSRPQELEIDGTPLAGDSELRRLTPCDQRALHLLRTAFEERSPVAFLIGDGITRSSLVIDSFLATVDEQTCPVRVPRPRTDATSCMGDIVRSIGFEVKDFSLTDLENIFTMFLAFQRTHGRRTVLCVEEAQNCSSWVFDKIFELAELELREHYGLLIILSGQTELTYHLTENASRALAARAAREIQVAPLTMTQTREFVVQQVESAGFADVSQVIEYEAMTRLHEISAGTPDTIYELCSKCLRVAAEMSAYPVTSSTVSASAGVLGLIPGESPQALEPVECADQCLDQVEDINPVADGSIRLTVRLRDRAHREQTLFQDCISIGRDSGNDICIPSLLVSRHHALIVKNSEGVKLMDLGSTNGSVVNGEKVTSCKLASGDSIMLGDCRIEFVSAELEMDDIVGPDIIGSNISNRRGIGIASLERRRWTNVLAKIGRFQNTVLHRGDRAATASRRRDLGESRQQDET